MPKSLYVNFPAVKAALTMEQVLKHYGVFETLKKSGDKDSLTGPCPIHKGSNPTQFRVSTSKNIWNCFSKCERGGNVLDFVAKMEKLTIHQAALKAIDVFRLDKKEMTQRPEKDDEESGEHKKEERVPVTKPTPTQSSPAEDNGEPNAPLKFMLDKLERAHPYLTERGLTQETIIDFGVGFCTKGMMKDRVAIPIHNVKGEVVAYAGRSIGEPPKGEEKYKLPPNFHKLSEVFNHDRALKEPAGKPLVVVEGFFGCMKIHQHGHRKVIALMGSFMSPTQEKLIREHIKTNQIIVMLDEDEAGQEAREKIAGRLAKFAFVKIHVFDKPDMQPDKLSADEVKQIFGGAT